MYLLGCGARRRTGEHGQTGAAAVQRGGRFVLHAQLDDIAETGHGRYVDVCECVLVGRGAIDE